MKKLKILFSLFVIGIISANGQNLVVNPSFELVNSGVTPSYPDRISVNTGTINIDCVNIYCRGWAKATRRTPDYFHSLGSNSCASSWTNNVSVPKNAYGYAEAKGNNSETGNAYAGILPDEYIEGTLGIPLIAGKTYSVSFWVNLAGISTFRIRNLGAALVSASDTFSYPPTPWYDPRDYHNSNFYYERTEGHLEHLPSNSVVKYNQFAGHLNSNNKPDSTWQKITMSYTARGGENKIIIGNFGDDSIDHEDCTRGTGFCSGAPAPGVTRTCYYYIDNVSVTDSMGCYCGTHTFRYEKDRNHPYYDGCCWNVYLKNDADCNLAIPNGLLFYLRKPEGSGNLDFSFWNGEFTGTQFPNYTMEWDKPDFYVQKGKEAYIGRVCSKINPVVASIGVVTDYSYIDSNGGATLCYEPNTLISCDVDTSGSCCDNIHVHVHKQPDGTYTFTADALPGCPDIYGIKVMNAPDVTDTPHIVQPPTIGSSLVPINLLVETEIGTAERAIKKVYVEFFDRYGNIICFKQIDDGSTIGSGGGGSGSGMKPGRSGKPQADYNVLVSPNPVARGKMLFVSYKGNKQDNVSINITDISGREIHRLEYSVTEGVNTLPISTSNLAAGTYFLNIVSSVNKQSLQFTVVN